MLQDGVAWTKLPRGARTCSTPVQYLAPRCGGGRQVSQSLPGARVGPRTPLQCLESPGAAPSVGTGDSPAVSLSSCGSVLLGTGVASVGMPHPRIPRRCGVPCHHWKPVPVGWWVSFKLFQTGKKKKKSNHKIWCPGLVGGMEGLGGGMTIGQGDGTCPSPRVMGLLVDVGAGVRSRCWGACGCLHVGLSPSGLA